jgi:hypothetical protein
VAPQPSAKSGGLGPRLSGLLFVNKITNQLARGSRFRAAARRENPVQNQLIKAPEGGCTRFHRAFFIFASNKKLEGKTDGLCIEQRTENGTRSV